MESISNVALAQRERERLEPTVLTDVLFDKLSASPSLTPAGTRGFVVASVFMARAFAILEKV
jgi:hypothetical protein